ncbi:MAG TPA: phosphonate C-P lyase system protein PhnH, partial [Burkholderiaceae bacterium]
MIASGTTRLSAGMGGLADVAMGFADPVHDAQRTFRQVLEALSRPGVVQRLSIAARSSPSAPEAIAATGLPSEGVAALLLTLTDAETSLFMTPACASPRARRYLSFHTGVREAERADTADFIVAHGNELDAHSLDAFEFGTDE